MGAGDDTITMWEGNDVINFFDGTATLIFHGPSATPANRPVYIEYEETEENLTVYAVNDFVIQLGN